MTTTETTRSHSSLPPGPSARGPVVLVGGAGKTGARVAAGLASLGVPTRVASRSGAVRFDWDDRSTWDAALDGAGAAYVAFAPDLALPGADASVHELATRAARHGVHRVVLLSGRGEEGARRAEEALLSVLPSATVVRCAWFAQNFSEGMLRPAVLDGVIALPAPPSLAEPFVDADDIAAVAVRALSTPGLEGRVLELTGPRAVPLAEAAAVLARASGRAVEYAEVSPAAFSAGAVAAGMLPGEADALAELFAEVLDGRNEQTTGTVREVLGREARSLEQFAADAAAAGAWR
ncbi:NmrA family transcriptional regulator [Nocardioides taihuensis]|uniref:NmrA family transcriptional regulator n=1 Tax=Nocardioides taihuensis TaxID=1835606 RepID=A0ABW0BHV0_9ACTN